MPSISLMHGSANFFRGRWQKRETPYALRPINQMVPRNRSWASCGRAKSAELPRLRYAITAAWLVGLVLSVSTFTMRAAPPFFCADAAGSQVALVSAGMEIEWQFADHEHFKTVSQIQLLDMPGDVANGEILR